MDSRMSARKPLHERVTLNSPRIGSVSANTRDVSLGGMFVETGALVLPPNAAVDVSFWIADNSSSRETFNLKAMVVRRQSNGAGLMFVQMETDVIRTLSSALSRYNPERPNA
jgi:hypothetical protein